ncbi:MAG TPA: hypothetical protein DCO71_03830 [Gammaproteobacteria bacterium]|nr:hypothetical protein [Gammaproteobacteria bacterium]
MSTPDKSKRHHKHAGPLRFFGRTLVRTSAVLFLLQIALATPWLDGIVESWLQVADTDAMGIPEYIVVLGGGGIPSDTGLMRAYYGATQSIAFADATVIVALPADENPETSSVGRMKDELMLRGVPAAKILMETKGLNTHEQADNIRGMLDPGAIDDPVLLVTERSHLRRSLLCFRKAGFSHVFGVGTHNTGAEADLEAGTFLRYTLWTNLQLQIRVLREMIATGMYKLRGWI